VTNFLSVALVHRDGRRSDSLLGPFRKTLRWTPDGRGIVLFRGLSVKEDDLDRLTVDREGRIGGRTVVLPRVSALLRGEFDVARHAGRLAFVAGTLNMDVWTFDLPPARPALQQRTSGTTYYSVPAMSPDGSRLYYLRGDARGDNLYQLTLPDAEEAMRDGRQPGGFYNVNVSRDHRRVILGQSESNGTMLYEFDIATRQSRSARWDVMHDGTQAPRTAGTRALVFVTSDGRQLVFQDSLGGARRGIDVPDSLRLGAFDVSPDGREAAALVITAEAVRLGITSLSEWQFREVHRFNTGERPVGVNWSDDGWIYVVAARDAGPAVVSRIRAGQSQLTEVLALPAGCSARTVTVASASPRGACLRIDNRGDIWVADLPGLAQ
jgi:hypothetical protein